MVASLGAQVLDPPANRPSQPALASVLAEVTRQLLGRCPRAQLVDVLVLQDRPAIDGVLSPSAPSALGLSGLLPADLWRPVA